MSEQSPSADLPMIRPIRASDAAGLQAFHRRLSEETVRRRFFSAHPQLSDEEARDFTELDATAQVALVATAGRRIVAVGRYIRVPDLDTAEVAFVVDDRYQRRGIGSRLLAMLAPIAWSQGIRFFVADTQSDNRAMLRVFFRSTDAVTVQRTTSALGVTHVVMELVPPARKGLARSAARSHGPPAAA